MNEKAIEAAHDAAKAAARSIGLNVDTMTDGEITGSEIAVIIRAAIAAYEKAMWRPIEEAPLFSEWQEVFVIGGRYKHPTVKLSDGEWWKSQKGKIAGIPTHFRPLPPVPEDE